MKAKFLLVSLIALGLINSAALALDQSNTKTTKKNNTINLTTATAAATYQKQQKIIDENAVVNTTTAATWFNRITVGGLLNTELSWSDHEPLATYTNSGAFTDLYVNNANLLVDARLNKLAALHFNLAYVGLPTFTSGVKDSPNKTVNVSDAYITIADFARTPFYTRVGKQYMPFGDYERYPVLNTSVQIIEEVSQPAILVGAVTDSGFYAQAYAFNGPTKEPTDTKYSIRNFGAKIGYYGDLDYFNAKDARCNLNVSWIRNIYDGDNMVANFVDNSDAGTHITGGRNATNRVGGLAGHFDLAVTPFDFAANYVATLNSLVQNISSYGLTSYTTNSRLWAADVNAGYSFKTMNHDSRMKVTYQWSGNAQFTADLYTPAELSLAHYVISAEYKVNLLKNIDFTLAGEHTKSYEYRSAYTAISHASGTRETNIAIGRLAVKF